MKTPTLFNIPQDSPSAETKLAAFMKAHGILTYRTKGMSRKDHPWLALIPFPDDAGKDIGLIMAESCGLYSDAGQLSTGEGELTAVRNLCKSLNIVCNL
jgi:hypothetical protein